MSEHDVAMVGAGPAGVSVALICATADCVRY